MLFLKLEITFNWPKRFHGDSTNPPPLGNSTRLPSVTAEFFTKECNQSFPVPSEETSKPFPWLPFDIPMPLGPTTQAVCSESRS